MKPLRILSLFSALLACAPGLLHAQTEGRLTGRWTGVIEVPGTELGVELSFRLEAGEYRGTITIPLQGASDLPLSGIRQPGDSAVFTIQAVPGEPTFNGVFSPGDSAVSGTFIQGALTVPFRITRAEAAGRAAAEVLAVLDSIVPKALADFRVPGVAIGVVRRGVVIYARGFGHRDVANQLPVTPQTQFAIGSSTKAFTTFALGQLADEGRFDWDTPVHEYLPGLQLRDPAATSQLTARDMVTHRTGLPRHDLAWYNRADLTSDDLFGRLAHFEPNRALRQQWQYNNIMYVMAGHLLGRLTGGAWSDAVRRQIFEPLGMTSSNFSVSDMQRAPDHALGYRERGDTLVPMAFRNIDNVGPAGAINSSVEDMLKWAAVHVNLGRAGEQQLIQPATLRDMHTPHMVIGGIPAEAELSPASYGLGWFIHTYRGRYRVQHGGNIDGFSALVTLFPRDQLAVVVLSNKNATPLPALLTDHAVDRLLELPHRDWLAAAHAQLVAARAAAPAATQRLADERHTGTRPAFELDAYAGEYVHPGYGTLHVTREGRGLAMRFNAIATPLEHWHYEVFSGQDNLQDPVFHRAKLQFSSDLRGQVDAVQVTLEPSVPPIRFARAPDARLADAAYLRAFAGRYNMEAGGAVNVTLRGNTLLLEIPGQPPYPLEPGRNNEFALAALQGYTLRFVLAADGSVRELRMIQPNGVFVARPIR